MSVAPRHAARRSPPDDPPRDRWSRCSCVLLATLVGCTVTGSVVETEEERQTFTVGEQPRIIVVTFNGRISVTVAGDGAVEATGPQPRLRDLVGCGQARPRQRGRPDAAAGRRHPHRGAAHRRRPDAGQQRRGCGCHGARRIAGGAAHGQWTRGVRQRGGQGPGAHLQRLHHHARRPRPGPGHVERRDLRQRAVRAGRAAHHQRQHRHPGRGRGGRSPRPPPTTPSPSAARWRPAPARSRPATATSRSPCRGMPRSSSTARRPTARCERTSLDLKLTDTSLSGHTGEDPTPPVSIVARTSNGDLAVMSQKP